MFKKLVKLFLPNAETLSNYAAEGIQKAINNADKEAQIAKYADLVDKATDVQKFVTEILLDGKIDDVEKEDIAKKIEPLMVKLIEII